MSEQVAEAAVITAPKIYYTTAPDTFEVVESLIKKLTWVARVIVVNPAVPVLENIFFCNGVMFASDLQTTTMHVTSIKGAFLVPGKMLLSILKNLDKKDKVSFAGDGQLPKISLCVNGEALFSIGSEHIGDFPSSPLKSIDITVGEMSGSDMESLQLASKYASTDDLRPAMTGVFMDFHHIVATNGHWLCLKAMTESKFNGEELSAIIPSRVMSFIKDFTYCTVRRNESKENYLFKQENRAVLCRTIDERYPDYMNVIPRQNHIKLTLDKKKFLMAMNLALETANKTTRQVRLAFKNGCDLLTISSEDIDFGHEFRKVIDATVVFGPKLTFVDKDTEKLVPCAADDKMDIGFNLKFMIAIVKNIESNVIELSMSAPNKAILVNNDILVMPVMLTQYV